jgi:hypothetical protein
MDAFTALRGTRSGICEGNFLPVLIGMLKETVSAETPATNPVILSAYIGTSEERSLAKLVRVAYSKTDGTRSHVAVRPSTMRERKAFFCRLIHKSARNELKATDMNFDLKSALAESGTVEF